MKILGLRLGWKRGAIGAAALAVVFAPILLLGAATDPNILWKIVNGRCVPDQRHLGSPLPCSLVDLTGGYAILKDIVGRTQYLLIPTKKLGGIESADLLTSASPNYFAEAWSQIGLVRKRAGADLPRQDLSLAINSESGRSQQQLHIHLDCIRREVRDALAAHAGAIGSSWSAFPQPLAGSHYRAMRIMGESLGTADPFTLLAAQPAARAAMGRHSLVLAGATFAKQPGFVLLDTETDTAHGNWGVGELLQDHNCALAAHP
jgi:CDP-diacylglycerol pyrophosphatase